MAAAALAQHEKTPGNRGFFFVGLALLLPLTAAVFSCGLPGIFLLDDLGNLEAFLDPSGGPLDLWQATFSNASGLLWRPLSNLTLALNLAHGGFDPAPFKATNVAFHLLTTAAVAEFARRLLPHLVPAITPQQATLSALLTAALWALHPLQVSTVLYVVQRMALLSGLFSAIAITSLLARRDRSPPADWHAAVAFALASLLALASKENGALTPLLALTVALCAPSAIPSKTLRYCCIVLPMLAGVILTALLWKDLVAGYAGREFTLSDRLATQPFVLASYVRDTFAPLPSRLAVFRDDTLIRHAGDPLAMGAIVLLAAMVVSTLWLRRRQPLIAFGIMWFLACHAMESTFLPLELEFEHRNYLALFGPALAIAVLIVRLAGLPPSISLRHGLVLAPVAIMAGLTALRSEAWSAAESLAMLEVANRPDSMRANNLAAIVARQQGDTVSPVRLMRRMQERYPLRFFPWASELDFACDLGPSTPIPWQEISHTARRAPGTDEVLGYFNHITLKIRAGRCKGISPAEWDARLKALAAEMRDDGSIRDSQYITVLRASLKELEDVLGARTIYLQALSQGEAPDLLFRVALFEAEHGDVDKAEALIRQLRRHWQPGHPQARRIVRLQQIVELRNAGAGPGRTDR